MEKQNLIPSECKVYAPKSYSKLLNHFLTSYLYFNLSNSDLQTNSISITRGLVRKTVLGPDLQNQKQ